MSKKLVGLAMVLLMSVVARAAVEDTPASLKQLYDDGKYAQLLPKLTRALSLKGAEADNFNRYDLLIMKGESLLHTHSATQAADAFRDAAKATDKPDDAAMALATSALIKHSPGLKYTPKVSEDKGAKPTPIDIVDPSNRKQAIAALSKDLLAKAKPQAEAAAKATTLPQVMSAAATLGEIRACEVAGTGSDTESASMLQDLAKRAEDLLTGALDKMTDRIKAIDTEAESRLPNTTNNPNTPNTNKPMGLTQPRVKELSQMVDSAGQISEAAKSLQASFGPKENFKAVQARSAGVAEEANRELSKFGKKPNPNVPT